MRFGANRVVTRMVVVVAAVGTATVGLTACSEEIPTDYTAAHREAFLAACSRPLDDPRLLSDVCACVYDRIEDELPFDEYQLLSERLAEVPVTATAPTVAADSETDEGPSVTAAALPDELAPLVADCFVVEADL